jgi:hypothetical protein
MIFNPYPIILGDKVEMNDMGGACSTYRRKKRRVQGFGVEK